MDPVIIVVVLIAVLAAISLIKWARWEHKKYFAMVNALSVLHTANRPLTMKELSERIGCDIGSTTDILSRLGNLRLVKAVPLGYSITTTGREWLQDSFS